MRGRRSLPFLSKSSTSKRRRALTPPLSSDIKPRQQFLAQQQCPFLFELPYEIRLQIYNEIFDDGPVHVEMVEDWGGGLTKKPKKPKKKEVKTQSGNNTIMALLQTCRLLYTELCPILLSRTLIVPSLATFRYMLEIIPPSHFQHIASLNLRIYHPYLLFPVRDLPAKGSWQSRIVKQLQHFDVPLWHSIWSALSIGGPDQSMLNSPAEGKELRKGSLSSLGSRKASVANIGGGTGLTSLRHLHISMGARDYTSMNQGWPKAPEDIVANELWEPVLAFARSRGWPNRWVANPTKTRNNGSFGDMELRNSETNVGADYTPLVRWSIDVSWIIAPEKHGKGRPPAKLFRSAEELEADLPFTIRHVDEPGVGRVMPRSEAASSAEYLAERRAGVADVQPTQEVQGGGDLGEEMDSSEESSSEEDEGYRSGGVGAQGSSELRQRQWWE